jgi:hypothetical protein
MKPHLARLERITEELNVWLLMIAFGLAVLYVTVLVAKCIPSLALPPATAAAEVSRPVAAPHSPSTTITQPEPQPEPLWKHGGGSRPSF